MPIKSINSRKFNYLLTFNSLSLKKQAMPAFYLFFNACLASANPPQNPALSASPG